MSRVRLCNRCGGTYGLIAPSKGGRLELSLGSVEVDASLCGDCYEELVEFYRGEEGDDDS
jgi:hypothetical protein